MTLAGLETERRLIIVTSYVRGDLEDSNDSNFIMVIQRPRKRTAVDFSRPRNRTAVDYRDLLRAWRPRGFKCHQFWVILTNQLIQRPRNRTAVDFSVSRMSFQPDSVPPINSAASKPPQRLFDVSSMGFQRPRNLGTIRRLILISSACF